MTERRLSILGMGVVTDNILHIGELSSSNAFPKADILDPGTVATHDSLAQLALRAAHQAWSMANLSGADTEQIALVMQTEWGAVDSTVAYLESMYEAEGRYASPRHFSRSVYSSVASAVAIQFGIKGPCETLAFDELPIFGSLVQAWRLLNAKRCESVMLIWGEQSGPVASHLAQLAGEKLGIRKFKRYVNSELGSGAVALVVGLCAGFSSVDIDQWSEPKLLKRAGRPFAMDGAVDILMDILERLPKV